VEGAIWQEVKAIERYGIDPSLLRVSLLLGRIQKSDEGLSQSLHGKQRESSAPEQAKLNEDFTRTVELLFRVIGPRAFRPERAVNAAVVDSLMTGLAKRLAKGPILHKAELKRRYEALLSNKRYRSSVETGTAQEANVKTRLSLAEEAFAKVK
jgi:hypothetical protein